MEGIRHKMDNTNEIRKKNSKNKNKTKTFKLLLLNTKKKKIWTAHGQTREIIRFIISKSSVKKKIFPISRTKPWGAQYYP